MATIDNLDIQISASSKGASDAISNLITSLGTLEQALGKINAKTYAKQMEQFAASVKKLNEAAKSSGSGMGAIADQAGKVSSSMKTMPSAVNQFSSSICKATKHTRSLASVFGSLYANFFWIRRLFSKGLGAIEIASDLTEVQNVVDVTFGKMNYMLDDFAQTSRQKFGMSELSAKRYASQFQAMFTAMGVGKSQVEAVNKKLADSGAAAYAASKGYEFTGNTIQEMSLNLTKLAADMGSFFNQENADVAKRLQAGVISGQSRALRQYGIDLTMATLQAWALSKGIDADVQSMTQAEKTMLRYQYVMENMAMAQGDFMRTSQTWANQVRLLKQNFQALGAVIGKALIGWIKPAIVAMNNAMNTIIALVQRAVNAIGKLMGWQIEISSIGAGLGEDTDDIGLGLDDAASGAEDTAGGLGKAAKAAKELKKTILGFDELNVLNGADGSDSGSGAGGGAGGGIGDITGGGAGKYGDVTGGMLSKYKSDIDNWFELGRRISDTLTKTLEGIDWDKIYRKAERFGIGLADYLNGLITPNLFSAVGRTIAGALNTALHFLDSFFDRFNWKNLGRSLASGLNRFFTEFDFKLLAGTINKFWHGVLDSIIEFIDRTNWELIGQRLGTFLLDIDFIGIGKKIGKAIWSAINAGFKLFGKMFEVAPLETAILSLVGITKLLKVKAFIDIANAIGRIGTAVDAFVLSMRASGSVLTSFGAAFPRLSKAIGAVQTAFLQFRLGMMDGVGVMTSLRGGFESLSNSMSPFTRGLVGLAAGIGEFFAFKNIFADIADGTDNLILKIGELALAFGAAGIAFSAVFGFPAGLIAAALVGLIGAFAGLDEAVSKEIDTSSWDSVGKALSEPNGTPIEDITNRYSEMFDKIGDGFETISKQAEGLSDSRNSITELSESIDLIGFAMENGAIITESKCAQIKQLFDDLLNESTTVFDQEYDVIMAGVAGALGEAAEAAGLSVEAIVGHMNELKTDFDLAVEEVKSSQADLDKAFEEGTITQSEWAKGTLENTQKLRELNGDVDAYAASIDGLNETIGAVDFSGLVTSVEGVYELDMDNLSAQITQVGNAYEDASGMVSTASKEMQQALDDYAAKADGFGEKEIASAFRQLADIEATSAEEAKSNLQSGFDEYSNLVLDGLQNKIPNVIDQALQDYENLSPLAKLSTSESEYVETALQKYQTEVIDKAVKELEKKYEELSIDGSAFAEKAGQDIVSGIWNENVITNAKGDYQRIERTLKENWREIFNNVVRDVDTDGYAKDTVDGFNNGIEKYAESSKGIIGLWMNKVERGIHDSKMRFGSPSLTAKDFGKDTVDGYNLGITENQSLSVTTVANWLSDISKKLLGDLGTLGKNMLSNVQTNLGKVANEAKIKVNEMQTKMSEGFNKIKSVTSEVFGNVSKTIGEKIDSAKNIVSSGISAIEGFFSHMHLEFPQIKMPHFSMGTQDVGFLGQSITLPKINVDWYAQGGFPEDGLFFANHHELVGQFSNGRTAVANNEQIIEGIQGGVTRAIVQYLPEIIRDAVSAADTGGGDIYIGDEQIARAAMRGQRNIDKRYNPAVQF